MAGELKDAFGRIHTVVGIGLAALLFAIFWTGTLAVFDREIDRWMMPDTRVSLTGQPLSADSAWALTRDYAAGSPVWVLKPPNEREPTARIEFAGGMNEEGEAARAGRQPGVSLRSAVLVERHLDPRTGELLPDQATLGATEFFFPFHWHLMLGSGSIGHWLVGLAAIGMLLLIVTGVLVHKEIFAQFFMLRAKKVSGRAMLDFHNVAGVIALPFHFMIAFSGLAIFYFMYFPSALALTHEGGERQLYTETRGAYYRGAAGVPGEVASLDAMMGRARAIWGEGRVIQVTLHHPGDANAYVQIQRDTDDRLVLDNQPIYFDAASGELLKVSANRPWAKVQRFIAGTHFIRFDHWTLRWVYFLLGLAGCGLIATGMLFWWQARKKRKVSPTTLAFVRGMTIGSTTGIVFATAAYLCANRLLPLAVPGRAQWEIGVFFAVWAGAFLHAWARPAAAWFEQFCAIAVAAIAAVVLNAVTTGDALVNTMADGQWAVLGTDLVLLAFAAAAILAARKVRANSKPRVSSSARLENDMVARNG